MACWVFCVADSAMEILIGAGDQLNISYIYRRDSPVYRHLVDRFQCELT